MITYLKQEKENMIELLEKLVNIDSNSYDKQGVDNIGMALQREFEEIGMSVAVHREKEYGNHLSITSPHAKHPSILIIAHIDTVFPDGEAENRPFEIISGKAYGPGVNDEKASHVQVLYAMKALKEIDSFAFHNVHILFNSDEEIGSPSSKALIKEAADGKKYSLVVECGRLNEGVVTSRKGVGRFTMRVSGKSAHAGVEPEIGRSAIEEIAHKIIKLQQLNDHENGLSVNVGLIKGGTSANTVSPEAEAVIDVRVNNKQQADEVVKDIYAIAEEDTVHGTDTEVEGRIARPPMEETEESKQLLKEVKDIGKQAGLMIHGESTGGASDASFTAAEGIPTIDGMGPVGEFSHSETNEYTVVDSLIERTALLAKTIERLSQLKTEDN
ncbi:M20 family metallopeptidase [Domibacillus tundrae]|uniref:M20 family metallopeptidase n=2 Tax=Domibacillus tundrae TaxID=1587527 RepID=UPI0009E2AB2F|nr:M20 family metallopeptidase [Domibacillus tundrae]